MTVAKTKLAVLDDYQGIARAKFSSLLDQVSLESFPETLDARDPEQKAALIKRLEPFTIISTMRERTLFPADVIRALPNLKLLCTTGMKNAGIDLAACAERGIVVVGAVGKGTSSGVKNPLTSLDSTMEHTWALILGISRNIADNDAGIKDGAWETSMATGLKNKTLGVLGFGKLGFDVARVGYLAFGMRILAWSRNLTQEAVDKKTAELGLPNGTFTSASTKEELLRNSDVVSIHYVLSDESRDMIGAKELGLLKPTATLINTSRGALVNEEALYTCLSNGRIRGAALDVFNTEPLAATSIWRLTKWGKEHGTSNVLLSPHMGYVEEGVMNRWYEDTVANVKTWLEGGEVETRLY